MQHADIDAVGDRRMELGQQAFRRVRIGKAHAVDVHRAAVRKRLDMNALLRPANTCTEDGKVSSRVTCDWAS